jgi:aspartate/methionine/tyrosine aminotransferase
VDDFKFTEDALKEAPSDRQGQAAAIAVLKNPHNLSLRLYRHMNETFQDRFDTIYHLLEQAITTRSELALTTIVPRTVENPDNRALKDLISWIWQEMKTRFGLAQPVLMIGYPSGSTSHEP